MKSRTRLTLLAVLTLGLGSLAAPANAFVPTTTVAVPVISGTTTVGHTLTAEVSAATPATATVVYQWRRDYVSVQAGISPKYRLTAADAGARISVLAIASADGYTGATTMSANTAKITLAFEDVARPKIRGSVRVGNRLTVASGSWPAGTKLTYRWFANGKAISKATKSSYRVAASVRGKKLTVRVTGSKAGYAKVSKTSKSTANVAT